ncbi:MAG: thermonuclease family protein [Nitrospirota bacterium]
MHRVINILSPVLLAGCIGASADVNRQDGVNDSEVALVIPLDRPFNLFPGERGAEQRLTAMGGFIRGQVLAVPDGNTLTVLIGNGKETVQLIGIDAPETDQAPWGPEATAALRALVEGRSVRLELDAARRDHARRLQVYVFVGDRSVNLEMIRQGQALAATRPLNTTHAEEYLQAEREAREAGRGLWNAAHPLPISPDCHRKRQAGQPC